MNDHNPCEQRFSYFLQELTGREKDSFERHLAECEACREELAELRLVWDALPYEMEEVDLPGEWKAEVMNAVLRPDAMRGHTKRNRLRWVYAAATAVICFAAGGLAGWGLTHSGTQQATAPPGKEERRQPAVVMQEVSLKAYDQGMPEARGKVWLMKQGDKEHLVVELSGLRPTNGEWTYQLWMLRGGKRWNCGTMRVGEKGSGVMTYEMPASEGAFDGFGVTLEPDALGEQPRGKKVLGT